MKKSNQKEETMVQETSEIVEETEKNELALTDDGRYELNFESAQKTYCSLIPTTEEEKIILFNAINSPDKALLECVNLEIEIRDIYAETIEFINRDTGEPTPGIRIVLISSDGTAYQTCSKGVFSAISKLLKIMGEPRTWKAPIKIRPKSIKKAADYNLLTFDIV